MNDPNNAFAAFESDAAEKSIMMRILVMCNPTNKRGTKTAYTAFRKALVADGFFLWGPEVFMRVTPTRKSADKHLRRMEEKHPDTGAIRVLLLTERQFAGIRSLTGAPSPQEADVGAKEIIML